MCDERERLRNREINYSCRGRGMIFSLGNRNTLLPGYGGSYARCSRIESWRAERNE